VAAALRVVGQPVQQVVARDVKGRHDEHGPALYERTDLHVQVIRLHDGCTDPAIEQPPVEARDDSTV
jgi:hypothetical protein